MKGIKKRIPQRNSLFLGLCAILIFAVLSSISCVNKKEVEELNQQIQTLQANVEELEGEVADKEDVINQLKKDNADLQSLVPEPYAVQEGDTHWDIAYDYLTQKKRILDEEAKAILKDSYLFQSILTGFDLRNYSDGGEYGSFIVQGDAAASPGKMVRVENTNREADKVRLRNKITLAEVYGKKVSIGLKDKIKKMERDKKVLEFQTVSLEKKITNLKDISKELEAMLSSVYYLVGTKNYLKAARKTSLEGVSFKDFQNRIDLRETDVIELRAGDFNVAAITKVGLVPKYLSQNRDYRVEISSDGKSAKIRLLKKDKFQLARIILILN